MDEPLVVAGAEEGVECVGERVGIALELQLMVTLLASDAGWLLILPETEADTALTVTDCVVVAEVGTIEADVVNDFD